MTRRIPVEFLPCEPLAVKPGLAAELLSISKTSLWRLTRKGLIEQLPYGVYAIAELRRFAERTTR